MIFSPYKNLKINNMNSLYIVLCISLTVYSCGLFESNGDIGVSDKVYVALQGADTVRVVNFETGTLESIAINSNRTAEACLFSCTQLHAARKLM